MRSWVSAGAFIVHFKHNHALGCWQQHTAVLDDNMSQVCDEIFIDVHKLSRMCIVLKALRTINACFPGKHASRTCRFNHSSYISKNRPFSEQNVFAAFHCASHSFGTTSNIL